MYSSRMRTARLLTVFGGWRGSDFGGGLPLEAGGLATPPGEFITLQAINVLKEIIEGFDT